MNNRQNRSPAAMKQPAAILVVLAATVILIYANSLTAPFVFDDVHNILENPYIRLSELSFEKLADVASSRSPRPFANLTFALNYYFHGYDLAGYHTVNIAIHLLTGFLMFLLVRLTLGLANHDKKELTAALASLLWIANPVHTQSVTYIVQRMTALSALFFLLALYLYIKARLRQKSQKPLVPLFFALCGLSGVLALLAKQIAVTLPFFILLYEWYFFQDLDPAWGKKQVRWLGIVTLLGLAIALVYLGKSPMDKILSMYDKQTFTMGQRLLTEPRVIFLYLSLIFFPHPSRLNLDYDFPVSTSLVDPVTTIISIAGIIGLAAVAVVTAKKYRLVSFAIVWFLGNLFIESSFLGLALVFEHRAYLPSVFVTAALAWAVVTYVRPQPLAAGVLCAVAVLWGFWTYQRNAVWADEVALWQDVVNKSPNLARPWSNLGMALQKAGHSKEAMAAFEKTIALDPEHMEAHNNAGYILRESGRSREAIDFFRRALEINPAYADAHYNLGLAFFDLGDMAQAKTAFEQTLRFNPRYAKAHNNLGVILMQEGDTEGAMAAYKLSLEADPLFAQAYNNMGLIAYQQGDAARAVSLFEKALAVNPSYAGAAGNLARVKKNMEQYGPAITDLEKKRAQKPDDAGISFQLARAYQTAGMRYRAVTQYETTLDLKPDHPASLNALGVLYAGLNRPGKAAFYFEKLSLLAPGNPKIHYNLACLYARQNQTEPAVKSLQKALKNGYRDMERIRKEKDLDSIRNTEFYKTRIEGQK